MKSSTVSAVLMAVCGSAFSAQPPVPSAAPVQSTAVQTQQSTATLPLGRMFFTPAERAALDESRRRPVAVAAPESKPLPPAPEYVTLDGVVRRSDGTTTVWLNNRLLEGKRTAEGLEVTAPKHTPAGRVTVRVPQAGRSVDLRVGQQLEVTSGKIKERYQLTPTAAVAAPEAAAPMPETSATKPTLRRPAKERELLRELLREIEGHADDRPDPPAAGKG